MIAARLGMKVINIQNALTNFEILATPLVFSNGEIECQPQALVSSFCAGLKIAF
jgi:starvation-inducible outer membrane lipoprotein